MTTPKNDLTPSIRIEYLPHGVLIYGVLPLDAFSDLAERFAGIGCTILDTEIHAHYPGALMALPFPGHRGQWREELALQPLIYEVPPLTFNKRGRLVSKERAR